MVESIKKLREICQQPVLHLNTWYPRNFARKLSIYVTWLFIHLKISGNAASIIMLFTGIIASYLFTFGTYWYSFTAVLILQFWFILDHVDGELARYWKETSAKGIFLDKLNHHIVHPLIFLFIGIGMYKQFNNSLFLIAGGFTAYFLLLQDLINIDKRDSIFESKLIKSKIKLQEKIDFKNKLFRNISLIIYKVPGMMNIITLAAIFNLLYYIFLFYVMTYPIIILLKLINNISMPNHKFK